jgi:hypothetical protein
MRDAQGERYTSMAGEIETGAAMTHHVRGIDQGYGNERILRVNIALDKKGSVLV